jgi:hypothetical protein
VDENGQSGCSSEKAHPVDFLTQGFRQRAYFPHLKRQKRIGDDVGDFKYVFTKQKNSPYFARI